MERHNPKKLNNVEVTEQHQVEVSNRFAALENLDDSADINRVWESITQNIKTSAKESLCYYWLKQHKPV
jgi:hypothetical protein